jgi:hypothetical protein
LDIRRSQFVPFAHRKAAAVPALGAPGDDEIEASEAMKGSGNFKAKQI